MTNQMEIVGVTEIAQLIGVSRQRADQLTHTKGFPEPDFLLSCGRIWTLEHITTWRESKGREEHRKTPDPAGFTEIMVIVAIQDDPEERHQMADKLLSALLRDLGYGDAMDIFDSMEKWYG